MPVQVSHKSYLPKGQRKKAEVNFVLTSRDMEILKAVNQYRYLRSGQIKRLLFPENQTIQSAHRRLKYLFHHHYLGRVQPFIQAGNGSAETAYFLDQAGIALLQEGGEAIKVYNKPGQVRHHFLSHALDLSEFRLNLELALKDHPAVSLHRFTADFEIKGHTERAIGKNIYKLYTELLHPASREKYLVYPDALIILKGKGEYEKYQKLYFLEVDRGTMPLNRIRDKVIGYQLYLQERIFAKFGSFGGFTVLLQTSSAQRAANIRKELTGLEGSELTWITDYRKVNEKTVLHDPIWQDCSLKPRSILKIQEKPL